MRSGSSSLSRRERSHAHQAVLGVNRDGDPLRHHVRDQGRDADAEIDVIPVLQLLGDAPRDPLASLVALEPVAAPGDRRDLDRLLVAVPLEDAMHVDARQVDFLGGELAHLHELLHLCDGDSCRLRAERVEVSRGLVEDQIAGSIPLLRLHDREVHGDALLQHVRLALEGLDPLPLCERGGVAGPGIERGDAGAAGPQLLRQGSLRRELQLQLAVQVLPLEDRILPDVGRHHLPDLAGLQQQPQAEARQAAVVADDGEPPHPALPQGKDQPLRNAAHAEPSRGDGHPVEHSTSERVLGRSEYLVHRDSSLLGDASPGPGPKARPRPISRRAPGSGRFTQSL